MNWMTRKIMPVLVLISLLLGACAAPFPVVPVAVSVPSITPKPSLTPELSLVSEPTATLSSDVTSVAQESDDVWDRIVANNKIVVGTAWDYPPFSYVDSDFQVIGFDIAVIKEIGNRLNIPVDIQNFTFDGLQTGLQINQIDLAIAAISINPERASEVAFSPVYYVNQTAVLARNDSKISITELKQLVGYRVGVQRGTTYESMMKTQFLDKGLMGSERLLIYAQADEAIRDLAANRVDLVIIGEATASYYAVHNDMKVVGSGFGQQDLAIAMRKDTPRLKAEINRVMDGMLTDGTILRFIQEYSQNDVNAFPTQLPPRQPTATPVPLAATLTPPACVDGMKFISDVTFEDNDMKSPPFIKPGAGFVKTWRVQNSGTCTWSTKYRLVYAYGNVASAQMNGQPLSLPENIIPGQTIDLSATLIAPREQSIYQGFWQLENATGRRFGQTIWVGISTISNTENPTQTALPSTENACQVILKAPKSSLKVNDPFDAVWTVKNTSGKDWLPDAVDYKFISGDEMHDNPLYDFNQTIKNEQSGDIIVDMSAPSKPGIYNAVWAIVTGNKSVCTLNISVTVLAK